MDTWQIPSCPFAGDVRFVCDPLRRSALIQVNPARRGRARRDLAAGLPAESFLNTGNRALCGFSWRPESETDDGAPNGRTMAQMPRSQRFVIG
jgi:hypothetical protein